MIVGTTGWMRLLAGSILLGRRTSVRRRRFEVMVRKGDDRVMFQLYLFEKRMVCLTRWERVKRTKVCGGCLGT